MKAHILESATVLLMRYGPRNVTMDQIAQKAGISKKTLYQHFEDKQTLITAVLKDKFERDDAAFKALEQSITNPIELFLAIISRVVQEMEQMHGAFVYEIQKYFPQAWKVVENHKRTCVLPNVKNVIHAGIESGIFRKDVDPEIMARLYMGYMFVIFDPEVFDLFVHKPNLIIKHMILHFLYGMATPKGFELIEKQAFTV